MANQIVNLRGVLIGWKRHIVVNLALQVVDPVVAECLVIGFRRCIRCTVDVRSVHERLVVNRDHAVLISDAAWIVSRCLKAVSDA
ncbi:hypothetical protein D3C75_693450 [compost metagenome]